MEELRESLKLFQELKDSSLPQGNDSLDDLIKKRDVYDINPNTNYYILDKSIDESNEQLMNNFLYYNQTLTFSQRKLIISKLLKTDVGEILNKRKGLGFESFMEKYFDLLKYLNEYNNKENKTEDDYKKIVDLFNTKYFVDNNSIKIPLIYGSNELRYSGLINNLYQNLFVNIYRTPNSNNEQKEEEQKEEKQKTEEQKEEGQNMKEQKEEEQKMVEQKEEGQNLKELKEEGQKMEEQKEDNTKNEKKKIVAKSNVEYPSLIIRKKNKNEIHDNPNSNDIKNNISIYNEMEIENDEVGDYTVFEEAIKFISIYLQKICSKEFFEFFDISKKYQYDDGNKFSDKYQLNPEIDCLFFHLMFLDLIITIYSTYGYSHFEYSFHYIFFEEKKIKSSRLKKLRKYCKYISCEENKEITFEDINDIQNKEYVMVNLKDEKIRFIFNPYDYSFHKIETRSIGCYEDIVSALKSPKNFSLNKIFKDKMLFNDAQIFELFKQNVQNMLSSNVINELYNQFENYKDYYNPFQSDKKDDFIEQTFKVILYMPIPFSNITGLTYKNYGLIILDSKPIHKTRAFPNKVFLKSICNISFKKVVTVHEIICHYCSILLHGNEKSIGLKTPHDTFIDYCPYEDYENKYYDGDGGDKGESILFGNKIKYIFIKGALFILEEENWNKGLDSFREGFIFANDPKNYKKEIFDKNKESKNNIIIKNLVNKAKDIDNEIKISVSNARFSYRTTDSNSDDDESQSFDDGVLYLDRISHRDITFKKRKNYL